MNNVKVTKQFLEYSKGLAEDILGFNQCCGHTNSERNRQESNFILSEASRRVS